MYYLLTPYPVSGQIIEDSEDSGIGNSVPRVNFSETQAIVSFAKLDDNYDLMTKQEIKSYLESNLEEWEI